MPVTRCTSASESDLVSLYELLEVSPNASAAVIKAAYRCLVQQHHPDKKAGDRISEEKLALINQAYAVLTDPLQRARYDEKSGLGKGDRRGSGRPLTPARKETTGEGVKVRPFTFRAVA
ncbi:MAG: J domain-containing protein [Betaproteobacteria bacterium]|nr:J domain-containing protein [Betaproteobacteria bacterium]